MNNLDTLETEVINARKNLSTEQQLIINEYVENNSVNTIVAWAMWFFLGHFGGHRFLFKKKKAILMLVLELVGMITAILLIGIFIMASVTIWWIIDAFSIPKWLKQNRLKATIEAIKVVTGKSTKDLDKTKDTAFTNATDTKSNKNYENKFESVNDTDGDFTDFSKPKE